MGVQPLGRTGEAVLPLLLFQKVENQTLFVAHSPLCGRRINHKGVLTKGRHGAAKPPFSTLIPTLF